ncbi:MAG TPA: DUF4113 domain-containing protein [Hymenobacter sp.]
MFGATAADQQRGQQLMTALDNLNARFGRQLVRLAATGVVRAPSGQPQEPVWAGRAANRSPRYATGWDELWELR